MPAVPPALAPAGEEAAWPVPAVVGALEDPFDRDEAGEDGVDWTVGTCTEDGFGTLTVGVLTGNRGTVTVGTVGVCTVGVVTDGVVTDGVVTDGVVTFGVVTTGVETDGTVSDGTETEGTVSAMLRCSWPRDTSSAQVSPSPPPSTRATTPGHPRLRTRARGRAPTRTPNRAKPARRRPPLIVREYVPIAD